MQEKSRTVRVNQKGLSACMPETGTDLTACSYMFEKAVLAHDSSCKRVYYLSAFLPKPSRSPDQLLAKDRRKQTAAMMLFGHNYHVEQSQNKGQIVKRLLLT